ncbi:MAG: GerMN domain-containing protein [Acidimicrobiales bacterium]
MRWRALALIGAALALSGCTLVTTGSTPAVVQRSDVPFGLLKATIPGTNGGRVRFVTQPIYVVDATGHHLAPTSRIVPSPPTLDSVLHELILGPTAIEASAGYTSAVPKDLVILQATLKHGVAVVALAKPLSSLSRTTEVLALGQLVFTARAVGAVNGVQVTVAGIPEKLLLPSGATTVTATGADERSLLNP